LGATPNDVIARLHREVIKALQNPDALPRRRERVSERERERERERGEAAPTSAAPANTPGSRSS
jgi:hypothetical protein